MKFLTPLLISALLPLSACTQIGQQITAAHSAVTIQTATNTSLPTNTPITQQPKQKNTLQSASPEKTIVKTPTPTLPQTTLQTTPLQPPKQTLNSTITPRPKETETTWETTYESQRVVASYIVLQ
jgi:hypothetical protein